jgi:hypothetical protein
VLYLGKYICIINPDPDDRASGKKFKSAPKNILARENPKED